MHPATFLLLCVVITICEAEKVPGCREYSNPGVISYGPLPSGLDYSPSYKMQLEEKRPLSKYKLQGLLNRYLVQYAEYNDKYRTTRSYITLFIKNKDTYSVVDYLQVNPEKWKEFEKAIVDADSQPGPDMTIRIKFMDSNCNCIMRVYDLESSDIVATATTKICNLAVVMHNPYQLARADTGFTTPSKFFIIDEHTKYPGCTLGLTVGVHRNFGPLHPHLLDPEYFTITEKTTKQLTGDYEKYKIEYFEYHEQTNGPTKSNVYSYVALSFDAAGLNYFQANNGPEYKIIDYLRVDQSTWKATQATILEGSPSASTNMKLRIKYLTKDCDCVMRVYDLRQSDIPGTAETRACNGKLLPSYPHLLKGAVHQLATPGPLAKIPPRQAEKYEGCDPKNNVGVLNEFGPVPLDLTMGDHYRQNLYTKLGVKKFRLGGRLADFQVQYKEFEDKFPLGTGVYAYLTLFYGKTTPPVKLDYIRVNHLKWHEIENAIVGVEIEKGKIRLQFLMSDCSCVTREYNLNTDSFGFRGKTVKCPQLGDLPTRKSTPLTERKF